MRIGVIGAGRIGGNAARFLAGAGHDVVVSFSRDEDRLRRLAADIGGRAATPAEAAAHGEVVILAVPWGLVGPAVEEAGAGLDSTVVIDTTNQFGPAGTVDLGGVSAARTNARLAPRAHRAEAFNTLTAAFQASSAGQADRVVMFYATDDEHAAPVVAQVVTDANFEPVRTGTLDRTDVGYRWRRARARRPPGT